MTTAPVANFRSKIPYQAALLGGVCAVISFLLIIGNTTTKVLIEEQINQDKLAMMEDVMPAKLYDNNPLKESQVISDSPFFANPATLMTARKNQSLSGVILQITVQGWGGKIQLIMGVDAKGEITGVRIVNHKETPGLADKIEVNKSPWITSFNGKSLANTPQKNWAVKKDGGEYDQFAGATITPRAVVKGVHQGMLFYQDWLKNQTAGN
jgi:Na+-translocating ferredoxin:NAD+ oxidoreductase subunit G